MTTEPTTHDDTRDARQTQQSDTGTGRPIRADGGSRLAADSASAAATDGGHDVASDSGHDAATDSTRDVATDGGSDASRPPVVVKVGGARAVDPAGAVADVAELVADGREVVVVHGGSTAVDDTLEELGEEPTYVETPGGVVGRFTDERTMEVFSMVMPGKLNTDLTVTLRNAGVDALGLSGVDGGLLTGPRKSAVRVIENGKKKIKRGDHSGKITDVNGALLELVLKDGYTPVVTVPMLADDGVAVNADADRAAAAVAGALGAELVVLTDVAGVYADPDDASTLIESVSTVEEFDTLKDAAEGFMTKKVMAAKEALDGGAVKVIVADANADDPILGALDGGGTHIDASAVADSDAEDGSDTDDSEDDADEDDADETEVTQ